MRLVQLGQCRVDRSSLTFVPAPITGDLTGRTWRFEPAQALAFNRWHGIADDDGSEAMIVRREKGGHWQRDVEWMRRAIEVARRPEVLAASTIRRFLDLHETDDQILEIGTAPETFHGSLSSVCPPTPPRAESLTGCTPCTHPARNRDTPGTPDPRNHAGSRVTKLERKAHTGFEPVPPP